MNDTIITIVTPFHNESAAISKYFNSLNSVITTLQDFSFEILCIDDGSTDDTLSQLIAHADQDPRIRVIELSRNFGKEAALSAGIDLARGAAVIPIDADLQDPPELIPLMIKSWLNGNDIVLARRTNRDSDSYFKRKTAEWFYQIHNNISQVKIPHNVGDFRLVDRSVIDALKRLPEGQRFMKGLFAWAGFKSGVIDYTRPERSAGTSKFPGIKLWNLALEGITSFSTAPLKIWTYLGAFSAAITFLYAAFILIRTLVYGIDVPGYASLMVVVLFFGSIQLISVGILGEYIGRTYMESKRRPVYLIRKEYGKYPHGT